ncbi:hypothetical protein [Labilibaculum antarcticum]|uniref:Uncharacterized protein n=1 Tax=Labilibaculum antarcticum TaxID=1717717 RepID=A0A1Y1CFH6_9BACT|nr:hypothetical protein [Labilibaculum antarcticum]BAX79050.1 hypothetical protein ALGA_0661 [Labilibaculum antarcticum]
MIIKKGDILYQAWINVESDLKEKSTVEFSEYHVTTVNKTGIHLRQKCYSTYGKLSKKNGDFGWLPLSSYAREYCVHKFKDQEDFDKNGQGKFFKSKSGAYRGVLAEAKKYKKDASRILTQVEKAIDKHTKKK